MGKWAVAPALIAAAALPACGSGADRSSAEGYAHAAELYASPDPGLGEMIEVDGRSFLLCPKIEIGQTTPRIDDACLVPGYAATSQYGSDSMLRPSVTCADGRAVTDAGALGIGYVGQPLLPSEGSSEGVAIRTACRDQL